MGLVSAALRTVDDGGSLEHAVSEMNAIMPPNDRSASRHLQLKHTMCRDEARASLEIEMGGDDRDRRATVERGHDCIGHLGIGGRCERVRLGNEAVEGDEPR